MKLLSILFTIALLAPPAYDLAELRNLFAYAADDESKARELISASEPFISNSTAKGYYGAGKLMMAKYLFSPYSKLKTFNEGKLLLESAIQRDSQNVELRFLRLSIQNNSPSILGYNAMKAGDKRYLKERLPLLNDGQLKSLITKYLSTIEQ
jgi:hypothetical protein